MLSERIHTQNTNIVCGCIYMISKSMEAERLVILRPWEGGNREENGECYVLGASLRHLCTSPNWYARWPCDVGVMILCFSIEQARTQKV